MARKRVVDAPVRITTASSSPGVDIAHRQRRYLIAMGVRTLCFVIVALVAVTHWGPGWLPWIFVAGAVLLPYIAVVMANASGTKSDGFQLQDSSSQGRELPRRTKSE
jgi:Flp pilus assembly protein TadB